MIENGCHHYKSCDDCNFADCRIVKLQNAVKKQKLKLFAKAYNQGRKETARKFARRVKERIHLCENISQSTDDCLCEDIDEIAKQFGVVKE